MSNQRCQQTIAGVCRVSGRGYWSGLPVTVTFRPAPADHGIVFQRSDLADRPAYPALSNHRLETALRTRLGNGHSSVDMVEHIMSALYALGIDNCLVECTASEMPGLDGSSLAYSCALKNVGLVEQAVPVATLSIDAPFRLGDDRQWIMIAPSRDRGLTCEYRLDYEADSVIPSGRFQSAITPQHYLDEIAPARTFVTHEEAERLQAQGLGQHATHRDLLVFDENGPIDNVLRFEDECVRHKLLDLIGDLALCGLKLQGKVTAFRSGHILNGRMADWLRCQAARPGSAKHPSGIRQIA